MTASSSRKSSHSTSAANSASSHPTPDLNSLDATQLAAQWAKINQLYSEANFLQSPAWQTVNQIVGHKTIIEASDTSWCLMIIKDAKRGRYLEVPGGPLLDWDNSAAVTAMFEQLKTIAQREKCAFIRLRPQLFQNSEHAAQLVSLGARPSPMHLHAEHTVIIDLTQSEDALLKQMRRQTRYEIRRAGKLGLKVEWGNSEALFREFHAAQLVTANRQHFVPPDLTMLLAERAAFGDQARLYVARTDDGSPIAYGLILIDGIEAEYFEAASTDLNHKLPGAYTLQWQVIRDLKKLGLKRYNLWGIAPQPSKTPASKKSAPIKTHRYAGVTTFKKGFGGEIVEFAPAHDIVIRPLRYAIDWLIEAIRKKKRHL